MSGTSKHESNSTFLVATDRAQYSFQEIKDALESNDDASKVLVRACGPRWAVVAAAGRCVGRWAGRCRLQHLAITTLARRA